MKIVIGSDHAAFYAKEVLKKYLKDRYEIIDVGPESADRCNYPEFAMKVAKEVVEQKLFGIILCGSGIGVSMTANRFKGVRAALCRTPEDAKLSKNHNNANVLCLGARVSSPKEIEEIVDAWFKAEFEEGRHTDRVAMFNSLGSDV